MYLEKNTLKVYFISGIGADYRLFTHVRLPPGYETHYIHWITPKSKETLPEYAFRLADQIDTSEPFILVGFSLGGIMSVEIAKRIPPVATILISSVPLQSHLPSIYKIAGALKLGRLIPATSLKIAATLKQVLFLSSPADRHLMFRVIWTGDNRFIRWAVNAVLQWKNDVLPNPLFHIHGTRDDVFPFRRTTPTHPIPKGTHILILDRCQTVNQILAEILPPLPSIQNRTPA